MTRPLLLGAAVVAAALSLAACASATGPYSYNPYEAGSIARVEEGTVVSVRPVRFGQQQPGSGAMVGGLAGATVGSQFGGDTGGHVAGAVIGGLLGAVVGDSVQNNQVATGFAYTIRRQADNSLIEIAQAEPQPLPVGARVHITYGDRVRVVPAY